MIYKMLHTGAENGVTLRDLETLTKQDSRAIRKQIEAERRAGVPILADSKSGYFLPNSEGEKVRCVKQMRGRAREILRTADAIEAGEIAQNE